MDDIDNREPPNVITSDTDNATKVEPEEAPASKKYKFRKFRAYNRGTWNGPERENKEVVHRQDNLHRFDAIASSLPLNDFQKERGRNALDRLNLGELGLEIDLVIFAVCVVVANADSTYSRYWPSERTNHNDPHFEKIASELSLGQKEQLKTVRKVMSRTNF